MPRNAAILLVFLLFADAPRAGAQPDCFDYNTGGWPVAGTLLVPGGINDTADAGNHYLLVAGDLGVAICNLENPADPHWVDFLPTNSPVREVATDGSLVAALTEDDQLLVGVLTAPGQGDWSGQLPLSFASRPAVTGNVIVVRQGNAQLATVDASDPKTPLYLGWVNTPEVFNDVAADNGLVFLASESNLLLVYDLVDPARPEFVSTAGRQASGLALAVEFPRVHVVNVSKVISYDLTTPTLPVELGESSRLAGFADQVAADRGLCVAVTPAGHVYHLSAPPDTGTVAVGHTILADDPTSVACVDGIVVVTHADGTLTTLDPAAGLHPVVVREDVDHLPDILEGHDDLVYGMDEDHPLGARLTVREFGALPEAGDIGFLPFFGNAQGLEVRGDRLVLATSLSSLALVDVTDPANPGYLSQRGQDIDSEDVCIPGRAVCALGRDPFGDETLVVYDVNDSQQLQLTGAVRMPFGSVQAVGWREHALVRARFEMNGILAVNCRDPRAAFITDWVGVPGDSIDLLTAGHYAYLLTREGHLYVVDLSNPDNLQIVADLDLGGGTNEGSLAVVGNHLFVADFDRGLTVLDIGIPAQTAVVGAAWTPVTGQVVAGPSGILMNDSLYRERSHLPPLCGVMSEVRLPSIPSALSVVAQPNPFNPRTELVFTLPAATPVDLTIHDLAGHLVRRLLSGESLSAGPHRVTWDGRDEAGAPAASAVYLVRLLAGRDAAGGKLVLVR